MSDPVGLPWRDVQVAYARWWYGVSELCNQFTAGEAFKHSEDFGDFAESIGTLMTFAPNPRRFDPPIIPTREEKNRMGHPDNTIILEEET